MFFSLDENQTLQVKGAIMMAQGPTNPFLQRVPEG
jgi:hypothetical protein